MVQYFEDLKILWSQSEIFKTSALMRIGYFQLQNASTTLEIPILLFILEGTIQSVFDNRQLSACKSPDNG